MICDPNQLGYMDKLEQIQRMAVRFIKKKYFRSPETGYETQILMLKNMNLPKLREWKKEIRLIFFKTNIWISKTCYSAIDEYMKPHWLYVTLYDEFFGVILMSNLAFMDNFTILIADKHLKVYCVKILWKKCSQFLKQWQNLK